MLKNTFRHLTGIGDKTERRLWAEGVRTWDDLLGSGRAKFRDEIERSKAEREKGNVEYFAGLLPSTEAWRLFPEFQDSTAYLDIETTGLGMDEDHITTIALYDGREVHTYVHGRNLDDFERDIEGYRLLVTYNGRCFDAPMIERQLRVRLPRAHIDLRFLLRSLGYGGGLKRCEKLFGIERHDAEGLDGYFAVLLWNDFIRTHDEQVLETLLAYNVYDVLSLKTLLVRAVNERLESTPFAAELSMPLPEEPDNPYQADLDVVQRIRRQYGI